MTYREKQFKCELCENIFSTSCSVATHNETNLNLNVTLVKKLFQHLVVKLLPKEVKKDKSHLNHNKRSHTGKNIQM